VNVNTAALNGTTLAAALAYRRAGLSVVPIKDDGSKSPAVPWKPFTDHLPTEATVRRWFADGRLGVGVPGGKVSGNLEHLDFDAGADQVFPAWCELVEAECRGLVDRLSIRTTPRPGMACSYRCRDAVIPGNTKLAERQDPEKPDKPITLIETRGEGGQCLVPGCPPQCHPSGRTYEHYRGPKLSQVQEITAAERDILWRCARSFHELPPDCGKDKARGEGRPGDDFNMRGRGWAEILTGWEVVKKRGAVCYWRRPGKDDPGWSATTGVCTSTTGHELLAVFSSNADPFHGPSAGRPCSCYSKFSAYALLHHNGDFKAAAKELARQGYGEPRNGNEQDNHGDAYEGLPEAPPRIADRTENGVARIYRLKPLHSAAFFTNNYQLEWLVRRLLVRHQPCVFGGPKKSLKTSILTDLLVSLASATAFLGVFKVYKRHRVLMLSGESGEAVLQETGRRICAHRGVDPTTLDAYWDFRLPQVSNLLDRLELQRALRDLAISVVVVDPLYLCLLTGADAKDIEAGNLFHIGPLLSELCRVCLEVGCTPILCHHTRKNLTAHYKPIDLEDLAFAGIQEFARQWLLANRRQPYEPGTGSHRLWLSAGGSVGHGGLWSVDVEEGVLGDDFTGRTWEVSVTTAAEAREGEQEVKESKQEKKKARQVKEDGTRILNTLDKHADKGGAAGYTTVRDLAHLGNARMVRAVQDLVDDGIIEEVEVTIATGRNHKVQKPVRGLRRKKKGSDGTDGTDGTKGDCPVSE
jgi:hypothetical protein